MNLGMRLLFLILLATAANAQVMPAPDIAAIPRLPCVTTGFGNTLIRGNSFQDKSQTWMQLYTADMAVSAEGFVFLTTRWEEGLRAAGIYKDGDALPEMTGLGVNSGEAVAVSEHFAAYARLLNRKEGPVQTLVLYERPAGKALNGAKQRTAYLTEQKGSITGLAIDEARDRVYFADDEGVKALSLKTMKPLDFRIALERAGKMLVDDGGALWVIQRGTSPYAYTKLEAQVFGSEPIDAEHGLEHAVSNSDKMRYIAKDSTSAFVGFDFGKAVAVSRFSLMGDIAKADFRQLKVQTSTASRDGPWTDVATPQDKLYGYPEEFVTLDASQPIRAVRVLAPDLTMCRMAAYAPPQPLPGRVLKYDPQGKKQPQSIESITQPMDVAIDPRTKRLFVADGGPEHQIHGFSEQNGQMKREVSWGEKGGWRAQKGKIGPKSFENIRGIGFDAEGCLYVCDVGMAGMCQSRLHAFTPEFEPKWSLHGTSFLDSVDADPQSPRDVFSSFNHYRDEKWIASTLDRARFPDDPRANGNALVYGVRRWFGKKFLITTTQHGSPMCVFRFEDNDEVAIPCALIAPRHTAKIWPPHQPLGFGSIIWTDANGDGQFAAAEYAKALRDDSDTAFQNIDDNGQYWFITRIKGVRYLRKLALTGLNEHGAPVWKWDAPENALHQLPAPWQDGKARLGGFEIDSQRGEVFLFGFPADQPNECGMNWPLGRLMQRCKVVDGKLTVTHSAELLHNVVIDTRNKDQAYGAALCGDYLFVAYAHHFTVLVYRRADLSLVGRLDLGPQVLKPLMDGMHELIVRPDSDDGFVLWSPHYVANAIHQRRWNEQRTGYEPPPELKLENSKLTWFVDGQLERRVLQLDGWSDWQPVKTTERESIEDPQVKAAAYRLRTARSDWSATLYVRP
jgi:hypothetical protein